MLLHLLWRLYSRLPQSCIVAPSGHVKASPSSINAKSDPCFYKYSLSLLFDSCSRCIRRMDAGDTGRNDAGGAGAGCLEASKFVLPDATPSVSPLAAERVWSCECIHSMSCTW